MKTLRYIVFLLVSISLHAQGPDTLFTQANTHYKNGKYSEALKTYREIEKTGRKSADLYYNLGNTYYKLNQIAPSIYYYEKALLLQPNLADAKHNLAFAQRMSIDAFDVLPKTLLQRINESIIYPVSYNSWAWLSVFFAFLSGLFFLLYYFSQYTDKKRIYFILSFVNIALLLLFLSFAFKAQHHYDKEQPAIVFSPKVSVKSEPLLSANESFVLHEGTKVQVEKSVDDWYKIKLSDGKIGWIPKADIRKVKE
jgi:tetratricopeptide (TPR) repeat protein